MSIGSIVEFSPPQIAVDYAVERWGYEPIDVFFIKPIIAIEGDHVDAGGDVLLINGTVMGAILETDSAANTLPRWRESRVLQEGELFVFSDYHPASFDSRYYGPIKRDQVLSTRKLLWAW